MDFKTISNMQQYLWLLFCGLFRTTFSSSVAPEISISYPQGDIFYLQSSILLTCKETTYSNNMQRNDLNMNYTSAPVTKNNFNSSNYATKSTATPLSQLSHMTRNHNSDEIMQSHSTVSISSTTANLLRANSSNDTADQLLMEGEGQEQSTPQSLLHNSATPQCKLLWHRSCLETNDYSTNNCDITGLTDDTVVLEMLPGMTSSPRGDEYVNSNKAMTLLYIPALGPEHSGLYTCHLQCSGETMSDSLVIRPEQPSGGHVNASWGDDGGRQGNEQDNNDQSSTTALDNNNIVPTTSSTPNFYNPVRDNSFRVGLGAAVGIVLALIFGYMILVRSRMMASSRRNNRNATQQQNELSANRCKPPSYDEVLSNPDKYPMSNNSNNNRDSSQLEQVNLGFDNSQMGEQETELVQVPELANNSNSSNVNSNNTNANVSLITVNNTATHSKTNTTNRTIPNASSRPGTCSSPRDSNSNMARTGGATTSNVNEAIAIGCKRGKQKLIPDGHSTNETTQGITLLQLATKAEPAPPPYVSQANKKQNKYGAISQNVNQSNGETSQTGNQKHNVKSKNTNSALEIASQTSTVPPLSSNHSILPDIRVQITNDHVMNRSSTPTAEVDTINERF